MFKIYRRDTDTTAPIEYIATTASETYTEGELLTLSSGALTKCGATTAPTFVSLKAYVAPASGNLPLPVHRIQKDMVFQTINKADMTSVNLGDKVTLHTDGAQVTATTSSGVAELVYKTSGTGTGNFTLVRF